MRLSRSFEGGACRKVSPLMAVSRGVPGTLSAFEVFEACRKTMVKLNMSSSSFESRSRNEGGCEGLLSGSCITCQM